MMKNKKYFCNIAMFIIYLIVSLPLAFAVEITYVGDNPASVITEDEATFEWNTDVPTKGRIFYGPDRTPKYTKLTGDTLSTSHSVTLTDLDNEAYAYEIHYLEEGEAYLELSSRPGAEETDLNNALNAFERALHYDRTSSVAAELIQDTHVAIRERGERLEVTLNIIATGERIHEEANRYREARDFANAISTYRQSIGFFEAIDDEFRDQANTAREKIRSLRREISDVINEVLDSASQKIDEGDRAREMKQYDEALGHYSRVSSIVAVIPEDESPTILRDKQDVVALADRKIEEANVERLRFEQAQMEQQAAQAQQAQP